MDSLEATNEYLNYIKNHINNVKESWKELSERCELDIDTDKMEKLIDSHDESKFSKKEFCQYRNKFYPTDKQKEKMNEIKSYEKKIQREFNEAWSNHKKHNKHHWQEWTKMSDDNEYKYLYFIEMICDWIAMSKEFGGTAREYYNNNKKKIKIPPKYETKLYKILDDYYGEKFELF